jgi:hypothetical protein
VAAALKEENERLRAEAAGLKKQHADDYDPEKDAGSARAREKIRACLLEIENGGPDGAQPDGRCKSCGQVVPVKANVPA